MRHFGANNLQRLKSAVGFERGSETTSVLAFEGYIDSYNMDWTVGILSGQGSIGMDSSRESFVL